MGGASSSEKRKPRVTKDVRPTNDGFYYRDPSVSSEFNGPFDESTLQQWYRQGYFHSGIQFRPTNSSELTTLGRLRELNGITCPFASRGETRDEEIRCLEGELRETKRRLEMMGEEVYKRIEWLEASYNEMNDDFVEKKKEAEEMRMMIDRLMQIQTVSEQRKYQRFINEILGGAAADTNKASESEMDELVELLTLIMKNGNMKNLHAALKPHLTGVNCMYACGRSISVEIPNNFIGHITCKKHLKCMKETGVSKKCIVFLMDEFGKFASKTRVEAKKPSERPHSQVAVRVAPEQQTMQKDEAVESTPYQRFIREILGGEPGDPTKASEIEVSQLVELVRQKQEPLQTVMFIHFDSQVQKCSLTCGVTIDSSHNFICHLISKKHIKYMNEEGVSRRAVKFWIRQFSKIA